MNENINMLKRRVNKSMGIDKIIDYSNVSDVDYMNAEFLFIHQANTEIAYEM